MADKLKAFDKKETEWIGLWWHPETGCFQSGSHNLAAFKEFKGNVRIIVKKNKLYSAETNRPNYRLKIVDSKSAEGNELLIDGQEESVFDKIKRLAAVMREGRNNGYMLDVLPSESKARSDSQMKEAIELVEEITGEKWEFSWISLF